MPEGHTIHRAARLQFELLGGQTLRADSPQGRFSEGAALLDGRRLTAIDAYGKHLFYAFDGPLWLHVHLGLFGKFRSGRGPAPAPRGAVRLRLHGSEGWVSLSGPTACEIIDANQRRRFLARIGPDPLRPGDRPARAIARITRSGTAFGILLMDQSVIGGIGNVYRAELAFRAGIAPITPGRLLTRAAILSVWRDAPLLLGDGERTGRMVTTRPADRPHPTGAVRAGERFYVYHRAGKPCLRCETPIEAGIMAARNVYWCPRCQPAPIPSSAKIAGIRERKLKNPRVAAGHETASYRRPSSL
jgi:formamidopyrimidine-DNA glycosylase